jgi:hypothetical protein
VPLPNAAVESITTGVMAEVSTITLVESVVVESVVVIESSQAANNKVTARAKIIFLMINYYLVYSI